MNFGLIPYRHRYCTYLYYYETWKRVLSEMTFRGLGIWDLEIMTRVGVRKLGEIDGQGLEQVKDGLRNGRSGISARAGHRRNGDLGLWVRNKEQWADRRVMTANTRVSGPRRVSRSSGIKELAIS